MRLKLAAVVAAFALLATIPLFAHHSFSAEYDQSKTLTLTGKMVNFEWVNPHSWIHVEVTNPDGTKTVWKGETVTLRGIPAKDGSHHLFAQGVTRADGKTVLGLSGAPPEN